MLDPFYTFASYLTTGRPPPKPSPRKPATKRKDVFKSPTDDGERYSKATTVARADAMEVARHLDFASSPGGGRRAVRASSTVTPTSKAQTVALARKLGWEPGNPGGGISGAALAGAIVAHRRSYKGPFTADKVPLWERQIEAGTDKPKPRGRPQTWLSQVGDEAFLAAFRAAQTACYWSTRAQICAGCRRNFGVPSPARHAERPRYRPRTPQFINQHLAAKARADGAQAPSPLLPDTLSRIIADKGGCTVGVTPSPNLTAAQKQARVNWAELWKRLRAAKAIIAFIDEKWHYSRNFRRRKQILLRQQSCEAEHDAAGRKIGVPRRPAIQSRRYMTKVMSCPPTECCRLGWERKHFSFERGTFSASSRLWTPQVAGCVITPDSEKGIDGKVDLTRCAVEQTAGKTTTTDWVSDEITLKRKIQGQWRTVVDEKSTFGAMVAAIQKEWPAIADAQLRLVVRFEAQTRPRGGKGPARTVKKAVYLGTEQRLTSSVKGLPKGFVLTLGKISLEKVKLTKGSVFGGGA